jgi:hypothetical protein
MTTFLYVSEKHFPASREARGDRGGGREGRKLFDYRSSQQYLILVCSDLQVWTLDTSSKRIPNQTWHPHPLGLYICRDFFYNLFTYPGWTSGVCWASCSRDLYVHCLDMFYENESISSWNLPLRPTLILSFYGCRITFKGTVRRELTGVESGTNR